MDRKQRRWAIIGSAVIMAILSGVLIFVFVRTAHGEEGKITCPTDLDPYDTAWVLTSVEPDEEYFSTDRKFVYQPDPGLRIQGKFVKSCGAFLASFFVNDREVLGWKALRRGEDTVYFLRNGNGEWVSGEAMFFVLPHKLVAGKKLVLFLYREGEIVERRAIPVPEDYDWKKEKAKKAHRQMRIRIESGEDK